MELDLPHLDPCVHAHPRQPATAAALVAGGQPKDGIDAASHRVLDRYVLDRLLDAPDVYVRIERAGRAV